jgi:hypothetical protein
MTWFTASVLISIKSEAYVSHPGRFDPILQSHLAFILSRWYSADNGNLTPSTSGTERMRHTFPYSRPTSNRRGAGLALVLLSRIY